MFSFDNCETEFYAVLCSAARGWGFCGAWMNWEALEDTEEAYCTEHQTLPLHCEVFVVDCADGTARELDSATGFFYGYSSAYLALEDLCHLQDCEWLEISRAAFEELQARLGQEVQAC